MGEIAIFKDLLHTVLSEPTKQFTLFGRRNLFSDEKDIYHDLVFHALENISLKKPENMGYFLIPVLPFNEKTDYQEMSKLAKADGYIFSTMVEKEDSKYLDMYNLYKKNPFLDTFAVRPKSINSSQLADIIAPSSKGKGREAMFRFYRISQVKSGKEFESQEYTSVAKDDLFAITDPQMHLDIKETIKEINEFYL